jgi:hypothetical protein
MSLEEGKEPDGLLIMAKPSGPDGDYLEQDVLRTRKGKAVVCLRWIPNGGIVRIFPRGGDTYFVWFKKADGINKIHQSSLFW